MKKHIWTRESITEVIKTCKSINDFKKRYSGAFKSMKQHGWSDIKQFVATGSVVQSVTEPQISNPKPPHSPWNREEIAEVIKTCKSCNDFEKRYGGAYKAMINKGWTDLKQLLPTHSPEYLKEHPQEKYPHEVLVDLISRCDSISSFKTLYPRAYRSLKEKRMESLLDGLPMYSTIGNEPAIWCVYKWTFKPSNAVYIGLTKDFESRVKDELSYTKTSPVKQYLDDTGDSYTVEQIETHLQSKEASALEIQYISKYRNEGYVVLNRHPGGGLGAYQRATDPRTDDEILDEIFSKYHSYKELRENGTELFGQVCRRNLYERVWERLPKYATVKYDINYLNSIIQSCTKFMEFKQRYPEEYKYIKSHRMGNMLSGLDRSVERVLPEGFADAVALVNEGKITRTEAAKRLGKSISWFVVTGKGLLKPARHDNKLSKTKNTYQKVDWEAKRAKRKAELIELVKTKYTKLSELRADKNLYAKIKRHGIYKDVSAFLLHERRKIVTRDDISQAVSHCTSYSQFMQEYKSEYGVAQRKGWTDLLDSLPRKNKKRISPIVIPGAVSG